jgi:hypothetical protein
MNTIPQKIAQYYIKNQESNNIYMFENMYKLLNAYMFFQMNTCYSGLVLMHGPQSLEVFVNVLNLNRIDLARKYYRHLQREFEKEEAREK